MHKKKLIEHVEYIRDDCNVKLGDVRAYLLDYYDFCYRRFSINLKNDRKDLARAVKELSATDFYRIKIVLGKIRHAAYQKYRFDNFTMITHDAVDKRIEKKYKWWEKILLFFDIIQR